MCGCQIDDVAAVGARLLAAIPLAGRDLVQDKEMIQRIVNKLETPHLILVPHPDASNHEAM